MIKKMFHQVEPTMSVNAVRRSAPCAPTNENNTPLACSVCGKKFASEKRYFGHLRIHSGEVLWSCDKCPCTDLYFDSQSRLKTHEGSWHTPFRPHKCSKCGDIFDRASQLDYHRRSVHLGEKSQICQICGKGFFRKNDLRTHLNVHLGTEQSICEICGRKFNHVSNLIRHCRTHAGTKPYPCAICGKRFTQISSLARHRRIHERKTSASLDTGENDQESPVRVDERVADRPIAEIKRVSRRRHYCRICGESFRFMVHLRQHGRLHAKTVGGRADKLRSCAGKERQFVCSEIADAERIEISSNASSSSDWRDFNTGRESNSDVAEPEPDSIRDHLMELDRKMNAIEIESDRDVSISISDILSPYNCDDIELTNADNLEPKLYEDSSAGSNKQSSLEKDYDISQCLRGVDFTSNIDPHLLEGSNDRFAAKSNGRPKVPTREIKTLTSITRDQYINKCLHVEGSQLYIEICESECPKSSSLQAVELEEIENVALFREVLDVADDEEASETSGTNGREKSLEKSSSSEDEDADVGIDTIPSKEPTLRLVQTETGEQFYELILNNQCGEDYKSIDAGTEVADGEALQADGNFSGPRLTVYADDCPTVEALERSKEEVPNVGERNSTEFLQLLSKTENRRESHASPLHSDTEVPMVRLVQNEDGEQFFELIREPLEYERTRSAGDIPRDERLSASLSDNDGSNIAGKPKLEVALANSVFKRDKKESSTDNLQRPAKYRTRKFQCTECDKSFSTAYNFKQHAGTHFSDQQQFQCKECGLSFAWKSTLNKHLAVNHRPDGPQKFVCEICPKVYSTLSQVNEHVKRDHLKERNHVCPYCGKSFFKKFDLKTHSRTHTNERPYVCRACGKRFHHQSHIIRHERIHSGERPYACDICQRTFAQPASLKVHRQRHRDVKIDILDYRMDEDDPLSLAVQ